MLIKSVGPCVFFAAMTSVVACGSSGTSSSGGSGVAAPDFAALTVSLTTPTGTLQPGSEGTVAASFGKQLTASTDGSPFGGSDSDSDSATSTNSIALGDGRLALRALHTLGGGPVCPGLTTGGTGTCACPSGGSLDYNVPAGGVDKLFTKQGTGPINTTLSLIANNCAEGGGESINGKVFINAKSTKVDNSDLVLIESVHMVVAGGAKPGQYDVDLLFDFSSTPQRIVFAVDVPDGKVLVSGSWDATTKNGSLTITDKTGKTTCTVAAGTGTCTGPNGQVRTGIKF